ncbi:hypothetical protein SAMN05661080_02422 [Modestobacter sp. DSM 44400]|uniref:hypothetical protein n=1 Tax=Modestobacter sp. DSM 44400 TaxID=1550230 RepID=UPI0008954B97|nr:hypothetical protein [Modestobacter sp. DSM 44400]SDY13295.1 hypothetical protein SAMN05661080_02422 [Modestobacter sp. DSM 44400]
MTGPLLRGLLAGATGTTVLNAVTYLDMALRGRPASTMPAETIDALAGAAGRSVPGRGDTRDNRRTALGELSGIGNGLALGVLASVVRSAGLRLSAPVGAVVTGVAAMAATDLPATALHVTDPRRWSRTDWVSDAVPHLAYGAAAQAVLSAVPTTSERTRALRPAGAGLTLRAALLGLATGGRSSLGLGAPTLTTPGTGLPKKLASAAAIAGELTLDKMPTTPDRTSPAGLPPRLALGAGGAALLAGRDGANSAWPVLAGITGAAAGSFGGIAWRRWASKKVPDWQAAVLEDGVALLLAALACLPGRQPTRRPTLAAVPK